jgi:glycosyltransferase involved in cell wall biosynthesis
MFKVLVIAYYYPPMGLSGVQRTLKFTKYMSEYNWEPTVLTAGKTGYYAHDISLLKEAEEAGIRIERTDSRDINSLLSKLGTVKMPREFIRKFLSIISKTLFIPDNKISWSHKAYKTAKKLLSNEKYDAIFVSIPPFSSFLLALKLKKEFGIPVTVDYRDMWYNNHFAFYPSFYHRYKNKQLEDRCLREVDQIVVVNRRIKERLLNTYQFLKFDDVSIIPHGFDPADFENVEITELDPRKKKLRILYSGIFYENVTPKYFIKAFKKLTIESPNIAENFELHFIGHFRKENQKLVNRLKLQKFVFDHGYHDHNEVIKKLMNSDVLWVMLGDSKNMDTVSAGKLFEYFGTKKPIIACLPEGASRTAAQEYGASFIAEPENVDSIYKVLLDVHDHFAEKKLPAPDEEFIRQHERNILTKQLTKILQFNLKEEI